MRQIKFRMFYRGSMYFDFHLDSQGVIHEPCESGCFEFGHEYDLMQFTGLHDRNGKEIYEGDIVRYFIPPPFIESNSSYRDNHLVKFKNGRFGVLPIHPELCHADDRKFKSLFLIEKEYLEVIGSVHENPKLLETK